MVKLEKGPEHSAMECLASDTVLWNALPLSEGERRGSQGGLPQGVTLAESEPWALAGVRSLNSGAHRPLSGWETLKVL